MTSTGSVTVTWLGHAATRIETPSGKIILIDPFIQDNPAIPAGMKTIDRVDLMLISHGHFDHMADAVSIAQRTGCAVVAIFEITGYLESKGVENTVGMNIGGTYNWEGAEITLVPAVHSSTITDGDQSIPGGIAGGFVIRFENGFVVYHAGDTALFDGLSLIGRMHQPDVALLPIGDHFTMGPKAAAEAIRLLQIDCVIPIHYGTWPLLTGTPDALKQHARGISGLKILALRPGDSASQRDMV